MSSKRTVRGEIHLPKADVPGARAEVRVLIEDVSRADAYSPVIAVQHQHAVPLEDACVVPFEVEVPEEAVDPGNDYSIRVHIDISGSGEIEVGDFVSTQSYPVLTRGYPSEAKVDVRKV